MRDSKTLTMSTSRRSIFRSRNFFKSFKEVRAITGDDDRKVRPINGDGDDSDDGVTYGRSWSTMLPELLGEIIRRVESADDTWPSRQNVVACACVCKRWRDVTKEIVRSPASVSGRITFPSCLKQPGPRDLPHQCIIKRNKKTSTFHLYLALTPPSFQDEGKFLLAAKRYRRGSGIEYVLSLVADDMSQGSNAYVGKISSDFLGTKFTIYDSQPPNYGARPSNGKSSRRFASKQISPQVPASNFEVGQVSYRFNLLKSRGPRRMVCVIKFPNQSSGESSDSRSLNVDKKNSTEQSASEYSIMRNKSPRWHEHLQCWCLNFHGRVTVASVKNFQLIALVDQSQPDGKGDEEKVLLQFGKVEDDIFTMDYRKPLSAFQAFAICLTSFGTKLACE